jgi:hypothetical protein
MRALLVTVLLLAAGCGFERAAPFAGTRIADVGPWSDLGPVTICDGAAHLVAPSLGTAGLCATTAAAAASCAVDDDCDSRERCVCGRCAVAVCGSADECGPAGGPFVCTFADSRCDRPCDSDAECAGGERCLAGLHICRGTCTTSADCQHGESCATATGLCVSTPCTSDGDCGGRACDLQRTGALVGHPAPLATAAGVELFFDRTGDDGVQAIWSALGDGTRFSVDHRLFAGATPSVARLRDGSWALIFAEGVQLVAARSSDAGATWSTPTPALPNARSPSLIIAADGTPLLYAVDPDGNITRFVGDANLVFTTPLVALTPAAARTPEWPDIDALASPFVEPYVDPTNNSGGTLRLRLWFAAHGTGTAPSMQFGVPTPTPPDYSIGLAVSADDGSFIPDAYDPVFDRTSDFINHPGELDPAVIAVDQRWLLYYLRAKADGSAAETLAVAASPVVPR